MPKPIEPAIVVTLVIAPAHMRSIAKPGTDWGSPARIATLRPSVRPWSPVCDVAAIATSSIRLVGNVGVALHQPDRRLDGEVIRSGVPVHALLAGAPEGCAHAVYEVDVRNLGHSASKNRGMQPA